MSILLDIQRDLKTYEDSNSIFKQWPLDSVEFHNAYAVWVSVKLPLLSSEILCTRAMILAIRYQRTSRPGTEEQSRVKKVIKKDTAKLQILVVRFNEVIKRLNMRIRGYLTRIIPTPVHNIEVDTVLERSNDPADIKLLDELSSYDTIGRSDTVDAVLEPLFHKMDLLERVNEGIQVYHYDNIFTDDLLSGCM